MRHKDRKARRDQARRGGKKGGVGAPTSCSAQQQPQPKFRLVSFLSEASLSPLITGIQLTLCPARRPQSRQSIQTKNALSYIAVDKIFAIGLNFRRSGCVRLLYRELTLSSGSGLGAQSLKWSPTAGVPPGREAAAVFTYTTAYTPMLIPRRSGGFSRFAGAGPRGL